jgi:hypothetical protein
MGNHRPISIAALAGGLALMVLAGCGPSATSGSGAGQHHAASGSSTPGSGVTLSTKNWCSVIPTSLSEQNFSPAIGTSVTCSGNSASAQWDGQASPDLVVSIQKVTSSNAQMLSNAFYAGQGDPVQTTTRDGYSVRDVSSDGIAYADLTLGSGTYLEVVVQANTVQELPADAASSAAAFDVSAAQLLTGAAPSTAASSPAVEAYQPDPGEAGSACELLPSAAVNALFGPLEPFEGSDVNNVSLSTGFDQNGNPLCTLEWYTGTAASDQWEVTVGAVQPTTDAEDSLGQFLSDYHTASVVGGVAGEVYGQGVSGTSTAGDTIAAVPMSDGSYLYVAGTIGGSTPVSEADLTKMLRIMVVIARKYPVSGLEGIGSLP